DLRREKLHRNIVLRSQIIASLRRRMTDLGFMEFQTPILTSSSPEGARDFLVPSRLHPGHFYALPQAPQQFKQLLMVAGFDRYFQIAPCFRDEDARADRSPGEFYQLDIEMSYVTQDDVFAAVEQVIYGTFAEFTSWRLDDGKGFAPFVRIPFREAMLKYGSDKPDLRIPIEIRDVSDVFRDSGFAAFANAVKSGAVVRAIPVTDIASQPRSFYDKLGDFAQGLGAKGLAYLVYNEDGVKGPIAKFLTPEQLEALRAQCGAEPGDAVVFICAKEAVVGPPEQLVALRAERGAEPGDAVFFICEKAAVAAKIAGQLRVKLGRDLDRVEKDVFRFCWIVDFPMFALDEETNQVTFSHKPFSMPQGGMDALLNKNTLYILAYQYDIVYN